jgi:alpha-D-xyloside xylohydrolase
MISVWGLLDPASETFKTLDAQHLLIPGAHVYHPSNPEARYIYWNRLPGKLLAQGWDAFWLDSAEPEEYWPHMGDAILRNKQLAMGNGAEYTNVFPLLHTLGVQNHWRTDNDRKRVFLLTRSAFLGQQRVGATVWSGDVYTSYWALSHQVPAGLNFALSGYPYWTTDIGGYWPAFPGAIEQPAYQELYARWFEFGTFWPIFRTTVTGRTMNCGPTTRLSPRSSAMTNSVIVSCHTFTHSPGKSRVRITPSTDEKTWNIGDQFMFGPAILVNPVLKANATHRSVYLPASPAWYDFWTGESVPGGQEIDAEAPLDRMPLYVRAGSILPWGRRLNTPLRIPAAPSNFASIVGPTANSICTKIQATATTTSEDSMR